MLRRTAAIALLVIVLGAGCQVPPLVTFHGDSMGAQARTQIVNRLSRDHRVIFRARERAVIRTMMPGIQAVVARADPPDTVIVELGAGDAFNWHSLARMRQDIRRVLQLTRSVPCVRWLSLKIDGVNGFYRGYVARADDFNRILARQAALYPNVRVAPYRQWAAAHPNSFKADGLHHTARGKVRYAQFIQGVADRC